MLENIRKQEITLKEVKQRGGIGFPLDWEDANALKNSFLAAIQIKLVNGQAVYYDNKVLATSLPVATHYSFEGTIGVLSVVALNGRVEITSSSGTDNSWINLIVIY